MYVKMKELGPMGGHAPGTPLDLPMLTLLFSIKVSLQSTTHGKGQPTTCGRLQHENPPIIAHLIYYVLLYTTLYFNI